MNDAFKVIPAEEIEYLDELFFNHENKIKPVPATLLKDIPIRHLWQWATKNSIYQIITTELLDFLRSETANLKTIEICAGIGIISRELNIIGTDSFMQHKKHVKDWMLQMEQPVTNPEKHVKRYEALDAVRVFRPECVVGAFVSQKTTYSEYCQKIQGSPYGVDERLLLPQLKKYIIFGNEATHSGKHIFKFEHRSEYYPWLISKGFDQTKNRVWIWENQ